MEVPKATIFQLSCASWAQNLIFSVRTHLSETYPGFVTLAWMRLMKAQRAVKRTSQIWACVMVDSGCNAENITKEHVAYCITITNPIIIGGHRRETIFRCESAPNQNVNWLS